jgi:hypothetical protein
MYIYGNITMKPPSHTNKNLFKKITFPPRKPKFDEKYMALN